MRTHSIKSILVVLLLFGFQKCYAQKNIPLEPCPKSPNCVCTIDSKRNKKITPFSFNGDIVESKKKLKTIIIAFEGAELIEETTNYLRFEFSTKVGNYIDDVVFYFDPKTKEIHYRSASRIGYGDFGANKRRMLKIKKIWES